MSIRRISDLPQISADITNVKDSYIEVSELQDTNTYRYKSKKLNLSTLCDVVSKAISGDVNMDFSDGIDVGNHINLSGDMMINVNVDNYDDYTSQQKFGSYSITSDNELQFKSSKMRIEGGNGAFVEIKSNDARTVNIGPYAEVENTGVNSKNIVNVEYLT